MRIIPFSTGSTSGRAPTTSRRWRSRRRAPNQQGLPEQLTLIFDGRDRSKPTQLHYGRLPVHPRFWSYDANRGILSYNFKSDGVDHVGSLTFVHAASSAIGTLSVDNQHVGVKAVLAPVSYSCHVALDTGASVTGVAPALSLHWDASDPKWSSATWIKDALTFTWQVTGQVVVGQPTYSIAVSFTDQQTERPWTPAIGDISALLDANYDFTMTLAGGDNPPTDDRSKLPSPASGIASVFPYVLGFTVSNDGSEITGALLTRQASQTGTVLGLRGTVVNPSAAGLYSTSAANSAAGAIAVYGGRLHINDTPVETASLVGNRLTWSGLTAAQQQRSGLPASGAVMFSADGAQFRAAQGGITGRRLRPEQVARQYSGTPIVDHPAIANASALSATPTLRPQALGSMTQFAFVNNAWVDVVQQATMNDFNQILLYHMPSDMRQTYYNVSPPILPTWLQAIAAQAPQGMEPAAAYQSLATAYLTNILSHFNEDGASQLNATRAVTWLKSQTATDPVFQQQTTAIYAQEFVNKAENAALPQYLQDQANPPPTYVGYIQQDAQQWLQELQQTIQDPTSLATMQQLATNLAELAINANLYWAYTFFRYLTMPSQLLIAQMISLGSTSDLDGSAFMRQYQSNVAILSQLDPSGQFAQEYVDVIKLFQIGNVLPTLFDISGTDTDDFVFDIQLVLNQIAQSYQGSSDPVVAAAVAQAETLSQDHQLRDYVELAQSIAASNAGLAAWDQLAPRIESILAGKIGAVATRLFMTALAGVGVLGIVMGSMQWKSLNDTQKAMLGTGGAALAIELVCAIVKRGVAVGAVLGERSIRQILKLLGTGGIVDEAYTKLNNSFGKWIVGDDSDPGAWKRGVVVENSASTAGDVGLEADRPSPSVVEKIFGRNLDEFLAQRVAAFVAVVFLVVSIVDAVNAGDPLERMADGWMAAAAGLDLIAAVAGWALGAAEIGTIGGFAVASICSAIGFLGILAALVGVALLLYMIFRPQKNPVQQFGSDYATPAGFFMPYGSEIDYFNGYTQGGTEPARLGCSFVVNASTRPETVLSVASDGTTVEAASQSYGCSSVFVISTNGTGQSRVIALVQNSSGSLQTKALTWAADNTVSFQPSLKPTDTNYDTQLWSIGMQAPPQMDGSFPAGAPFLVTAWGATSALVWNGNSLVLGSGPNWTISQEPMAPAGLSMNNIKLYTFSRGQSFRPRLTQDGSLPQTWSAEPDLPSFLTLDAASGRITQTATTKNLTPISAAKYQISVTNGVGTAPAPTASFTIEVDTFSLSGGIGTLPAGDGGVKALVAPVSYSCDVALNTGAFVTGVAPALDLHWDATDPHWSSATWIKNALTFTWQLTGQTVVGQQTYSIAVSFADQQTQTPWAPGTGEISALLNANLNFTLTLAGGYNPPADDRSKLASPASGIASVFPYVLAFTVSNEGTEITGALLTGQASQTGTVLGLRGTVVNPSAASS